MPEHAEDERAARSSRASTASSSAAQPVTSRPRPTSFMPWWWCDLTGLSRTRQRGRRASRARGAPRGRRRCPACGGAPRGRGRLEGAARWSRRRQRSGICIPRQMPRVGNSRADGAAHQRELVGVALLLDRTRSRVALLAVEGRVHVPRPAGDDQGVQADPAPHRVLGVLRVWKQDGPSAGPLDGLHVACRADDGRTRPRSQLTSSVAAVIPMVGLGRRS